MSAFTVKIDFNNEILEVSGNYQAAHRGMRERGTGLQLDPDDPEEIEIESITREGSDVMPEYEDQLQEIEETIWLKWSDERDYDAW